MNPDYMDFLCWVNLCLFPDDFSQNLKELGMQPALAAYMKVELRHYPEKCNVFWLWQNYCINNKWQREDPECFGYYVKKYLDQEYVRWNQLKEKHKEQ